VAPVHILCIGFIHDHYYVQLNVIDLNSNMLSEQLEPCYHTVCRKDKSLRFEGQTGITGTNPTQCHHNGMVLSL
jgi:hypothetical protein